MRLSAPPTRMPYRVRTLGHTHDNPSHAALGTYFDDVMLIVIIAGRGFYELAGQTLPLHRGMVGLILPGGDPGIYRAHATQPYEHIHCRFAGGLALEVASRISQEHERRRFFHFDRWHETAEILRRGIALWPGREGVRPQQAERFRRVDAVLAEALASLDTPQTVPIKRTGAQAMWEYMHGCISEPIDLDKAAAAFGVSKQHLCRLALKELGLPFATTWTHLKMNWAVVLLEEGRMSVTQIARRLGYQDPLYFSRVFRKHKGASPTNWHKK